MSQEEESKRRGGGACSPRTKIDQPTGYRSLPAGVWLVFLVRLLCLDGGYIIHTYIHVIEMYNSIYLLGLNDI